MSIKLLRKKIINLSLLVLICTLPSCLINQERNYTQEPLQLPSHNHVTDISRYRQEQLLKQKGVSIIKIGQYTMATIPSAVIFNKYSPKISWGSYGVLNDVACYISMFNKVEVYVNVYEYCHDTHNRMFALSLERAKAVANYLVDQGIDGRLVFARGLGNDKPIMARECESGSSLANSRIEISFKEEFK